MSFKQTLENATSVAILEELRIPSGVTNPKMGLKTVWERHGCSYVHMILRRELPADEISTTLVERVWAVTWEKNLSRRPGCEAVWAQLLGRRPVGVTPAEFKKMIAEVQEGLPNWIHYFMKKIMEEEEENC